MAEASDLDLEGQLLDFISQAASLAWYWTGGQIVSLYYLDPSTLSLSKLAVLAMISIALIALAAVLITNILDALFGIAWVLIDFVSGVAARYKIVIPACIITCGGAWAIVNLNF